MKLRLLILSALFVGCNPYPDLTAAETVTADLVPGTACSGAKNREGCTGPTIGGVNRRVACVNGRWEIFAECGLQSYCVASGQWIDPNGDMQWFTVSRCEWR